MRLLRAAALARATHLHVLAERFAGDKLCHDAEFAVLDKVVDVFDNVLVR